SPSGKAQPRITSSIWLASKCDTRSTAPRMATAARSSPRTTLSAPLPARPIGVRTALTITACGLGTAPLSAPGELSRAALEKRQHTLMGVFAVHQWDEVGREAGDGGFFSGLDSQACRDKGGTHP